MDKTKFTMEMSFEIEDEDIDAAMNAAFCGGIDYWCDEAQVESEVVKGLGAEDYISKGGTLGLHEEEENKWHKLTKENFIEGLKKCIKEQMPTLADYGAFALDPKTGVIKIDAIGIDSDVADWIIQYAIFGELVYG